MPESFVSRGLAVAPAQRHLLFTVTCFVVMAAPQNSVNEASANGLNIRSLCGSLAAVSDGFLLHLGYRRHLAGATKINARLNAEISRLSVAAPC
jgi:hypothetical protein